MQALRSWSILVLSDGVANCHTLAGFMKGSRVYVVGPCLDLLLSLKMGVLNYAVKHYEL